MAKRAPKSINITVTYEKASSKDAKVAIRLLAEMFRLYMEDRKKKDLVHPQIVEKPICRETGGNENAKIPRAPNLRITQQHL